MERELSVAEQSEKDYALRVVRKMVNVLDTWGNVLTSNIPGQTETTAEQSMFYFLQILKDKYGIDSQEKLNESLTELETTYPSK